MDRNRYIYLNNSGLAPSEEEIKQGWHYCAEWDQMLVGPGMQEFEVCLCVDRNGKKIRDMATY